MSSKDHDTDRKHARRIHKRLKSISDRLALIISSEFDHLEGREYDLLTNVETCLATVLKQLAAFSGAEQQSAKKPDPMITSPKED